MSPLAGSAGLLAAAHTPLVEACGASKRDRRWFCEVMARLTGNVEVGRVAHHLSPLVTSVLIVLLAFVANRVVRFSIRRVVRRLEHEPTHDRLMRIRRRTGLALLDTTASTPSIRHHQRAQTIGSGLRSLSSIVIWITALVAILGAMGVEIAPLLAGAGLIGVALGFGAQNLLRDLIAGTFMIFEDQFGVGDVIDTGVASGTVENISLRVTRLRDAEGVVWHVPNGEIRRVGNKSKQWARAVLDIPVTYDTDIATASDVIKATADEMWHDEQYATLILGEPEVWGVEDLGARGVVIRLVVKTQPLMQWKVARELRGRIKSAFDDAGIAIPLAAQAVRVQGGAASGRGSSDSTDDEVIGTG